MPRLTSIYRLTVPAGQNVEQLRDTAAQHVEITSVTGASLSFRVRGGDGPALELARLLVGDNPQLSTGFGIHQRTVA